MSNSKPILKNKNIQPPKKFDPVLIAAILVVILLILTNSLSYYLGQRVNQKNQNISTTNSNSVSTTNLLVSPESEVIYSRSGNITKIENQIISIKVNIITNGTFEQRIITVTTNDETKFVKRDILAEISQRPGQSFPEPETISLEDFKEGDRIIAQASENIKDKTEFMASEIQLLINY